MLYNYKCDVDFLYGNYADLIVLSNPKRLTRGSVSSVGFNLLVLALDSICHAT